MSKKNEIDADLKELVLTKMSGNYLRVHNGAYRFNLESIDNTLDPDKIDLVPILLELIKDLHYVNDITEIPHLEDHQSAPESDLTRIKERLERLESVNVLQSSLEDYYQWSQKIDEERAKQKDTLHKQIIERYDQRLKDLELKINTLENATTKPKTTISLTRGRSNSLSAQPKNTRFKNVVSKIDTGKKK